MTWIVFSSALHAHHLKDMILQSNKVVGPLLQSTALNVSSHDLPLVTTEHTQKNLVTNKKSAYANKPCNKQYTHSADK